MTEIQYQVGTEWRTATGPHGTVTRAEISFLRRSGQHYPFARVDQAVRDVFYLDDASLRPYWNLNDFGNWSWNLKWRGNRSVYYIHTTPEDEAASATGRRLLLSQSHGCIHIYPEDRDEMMKKVYLKKGIKAEVKRYGLIGPP